MRNIWKQTQGWAALLLGLLAAPVHAGLSHDQFTDAFGGSGIDSHWRAAVPALGRTLVDDPAAVPGGDGKALGVLGSQALFVDGTGDWNDVTLSVWILPSTAENSMQGLIVAANNGFSFADTDHYYLLSFDRSDSQTAVHLFGNGGDVTQPFPGGSLAGWLLPGNPHDGNYHQLTLRVVRDNARPLLTAYWDGTELGSLPVDPFWNLRAPFGKAGIFTWLRGAAEESRFDHFEASWDDATTPPAAFATFNDPFATALDPRWQVRKNDLSGANPTIEPQAGTIPSNDGEVLDVPGGQALLVNGTETWENVTVSASILPTGGSDLSIQGVLAGVGDGFNFKRGDSYFSASYLRYNGQSYIRLSLNGDDVTQDFPGVSIPDVAVPGNPLDGNYHTITLEVNRDNTQPLLRAYWDGQLVSSWGPDEWWSLRVPAGRVGVFSYYRNASQHTRFDDFRAVNNDAGQEQSITWYAPEFIDSIVDRTVASDGLLIPFYKTVLFSYGLGTDTFDEAVGWDMGAYTELDVPAPLSNWQRGVDNGTPGSSGGQVYGTKAGWIVDSVSGTDPDPLADIRGMTLVRNWNDYATRRPWKYGPNARLRLQYNFDLGAVDTQGSIQYSQFVVGLVDNVSLKSIWYCVFNWDSRGPLPDGVMMDTGGTPNANVVAHFQPYSRYITLVEGSQIENGTGPNNWYACDITRENLINALTDINTLLGQNYSLNPDDYSINVVSPSIEMYVPDGEQGMFAASVDNIYVKTLLAPPVAASVTDPFSQGGPRPEWRTAISTQSIHIGSEGRTIPSNDGHVLNVDAIQAVAFTGTEKWGNETVSASILPITGDGLNIVGVLGGMNADFTTAVDDTYFAATFVYHESNATLRLWGNGGDVTGNFPGNVLTSVPAPANAFDGEYHEITLKVNRDNIGPLVTLLWDGQEYATFGPDPWWNSRVSGGGVGLVSWTFGNQTNKFDNFNATWDDLDPVTEPPVNSTGHWSIYE